jgi:cobalt/nickel transport system ATP-binding protein
VSHHIIELKGLCFRYPDGTPALDGIDLTIHHGESVGLVGANGAGKSTLLQHLCGVHVPQTGRVRVGDVPVVPGTLREVRRTVGLVFQDPDDQLFMPTVAEDVAFGPLNIGLPPEEAAKRVDEALAQVDALHLKHRPPHRLSGGEKRAVAIATVLACSPDILVMDEPSANLDPRSRRLLIELLRGFKHTKVLATHDLDMVLDLCERTVVLHGGRVMADGPTAQIFADRGLLAACALEPPLRMQDCPVCGALKELPRELTVPSASG